MPPHFSRPFREYYPRKTIKGMIDMQRHDLPAAGEPDMTARSTEIRAQTPPERDRRGARI